MGFDDKDTSQEEDINIRAAIIASRDEDDARYSFGSGLASGSGYMDPPAGQKDMGVAKVCIRCHIIFPPPGPVRGICSACHDPVTGPGSGTPLPVWKDLVMLGHLGAKVKENRIWDATLDTPTIIGEESLYDLLLSSSLRDNRVDPNNFRKFVTTPPGCTPHTAGLHPSPMD
eukprot:8841082-Heterocapsa_arctica.AAC.1